LLFWALQEKCLLQEKDKLLEKSGNFGEQKQHFSYTESIKFFQVTYYLPKLQAQDLNS
jgi:hypothetical protein